MNTRDFSTLVKDACRSLPTPGLMYEGKAWIHSVWAWGRFLDIGMDLDTFKRTLVQANNERLITLSRCDLVEAYSVHTVRMAETPYMGTTFHTVRF